MEPGDHMPHAMAMTSAEALPAVSVRSMELDVTQLYRRYGDMVLGRCRSLLRNEADAQDAAQDVFLKAHRYQDGFRGESSPSTWLFKITTTTCLNRIRSRKRRPEDPVEEPPPIGVEDGMLASHELRDLVRRLLDTADEGTRAAVLYHYYDGMTHQEIGDLLGVSAAAIRKRISTWRSAIQRNPPAWLQEVE